MKKNSFSNGMADFMEERVEAMVRITQQMLPNVRRVYVTTEEKPEELLEITSRLQEGMNVPPSDHSD